MTSTAETKVTPCYFVSVDGREAPTRMHDSLESAILEAERLATHQGNQGRKIRVMHLVATFTPRVIQSHDWILPNGEKWFGDDE